jgi:hypothetical protein
LIEALLLSTYAEFLTTYQHMTDGQLLQIASEGGLTDQAQLPLRAEMAARKLTTNALDAYRKDQQQIRTEQEQERNRSTFFDLFGRSFLSEEDRAQGIEVRTKWFASRGVPIFPVASYRYRCKRRTIGKATVILHEELIDRIPLYWPQVLLTWAKTIAGVAVMLAAFIFYDWLRGGRR